MIRLENVTKIYASKAQSCLALDHISLTLPNQGFMAILGPSGCGKTTLLNLLGGLDSPSEGTIFVDGKNMNEWEEKALDSYRNQQVGFVFQNYYLIPHLSVYENIALSLEMSKDNDHIEERVNQALKEVGLFEKRKAKPQTLSGGQMQRVSIARALVHQPTIILADEPTGALDSKNAEQVLRILKNISKKYLVVMVTHNEQVAEIYADRVIELFDGKIVKDSGNQIEILKEEPQPLKPVKIPFKTSFKWAFKNLWNKKLRSVLTIIAGSIGVMGMGLILSMQAGVREYIVNAQEASLGKYPVMVTSYLRTSSESHKDELEEYPDTDYVIVEKGDILTQEHVNHMPDDFVTYMANMDESYYTVQDSNSYLQFPLLTKNDDDYELVSSYYFKKSVSNTEFANEQYDVLLGKMPESINELALVVDKYNRIDATLLESLGFNSDENQISFSYLLNEKEYRYIPNDEYYVIPDGEDHYYAYGTNYYETLYQSENAVPLKIVGILRENRDIKTPLFDTGLLYTPAFNDFAKASAKQSKIAKAQETYGVEKDVFTGKPFSEIQTGSYSYSTQYQLERRMFSLGVEEQITQFYYYTSTFEQRLQIVDYIKAFKIEKDAPIIVRSYDYIELVTNEFSMLVSLFSNILLVFTSISMGVSGLLIGILMYISVLERNKEIGLLRSMGARKKDVAMMFMMEATAIGILSGVVGSLLAILLNRPVSGVTKLMLAQYTSSMLDQASVHLEHFRLWCIPIMILASVIVTLIAGLIPALKAAKKEPASSLKSDI